MSGQFPDQILDPAIRKLEQKLGVVLDRDAIRGRLEQEVGFADYRKYSREQSILNGHYITTRYPNSLPDSISARVYTEDAAKEAVRLAREIVAEVGRRLKSK